MQTLANQVPEHAPEVAEVTRQPSCGPSKPPGALPHLPLKNPSVAARMLEGLRLLQMRFWVQPEDPFRLMHHPRRRTSKG
jgi:hypothetical protein